MPRTVVGAFADVVGRKYFLAVEADTGNVFVALNCVIEAYEQNLVIGPHIPVEDGDTGRLCRIQIGAGVYVGCADSTILEVDVGRAQIDLVWRAPCERKKEKQSHVISSVGVFQSSVCARTVFLKKTVLSIVRPNKKKTAQ